MVNHDLLVSIHPFVFLFFCLGLVMDPSLLVLEQERMRLIKEIRVVQKYHAESLAQLALAEEGWSIVEAEVRRRQEAANVQHDAKIAFLMHTIDKQYAQCDELRAQLGHATGELNGRREERVRLQESAGETARILSDLLAQVSITVVRIQDGAKEDACVISATDAKLHKDMFDLQHTTQLLQRRTKQLEASVSEQQAKEDSILATTKEKLAALDDTKSRQLECFTHDVYFLANQIGAAAAQTARHSPSPHVPLGCEQDDEELPRDPRKDPRLHPTPRSISGERKVSTSPTPFSRAPRIRWPHHKPTPS